MPVLAGIFLPYGSVIIVIVKMVALTSHNDRALMLGLYQDHYCLVRKVIHKITQDSNSDEDLSSDTYIKLIRNISSLRILNCRKTVAYLVYTARSVAVDLSHVGTCKTNMCITAKIPTWPKTSLTLQLL